MGILDGIDPTTAGILSAAFQGLQSSGPSRMPQGLGSIIGQAGEAGMAGYSGAYNTRLKALQAEKLRQDLELQQQMPFLLGSGGMTNPDQLESLGKYLAARGHPGGATFITQAEKLRAQQELNKTAQAFKSTPEVLGSAEEGPPQQLKTGSPGLFGPLMSSPYVGDAAKAFQAQVNQGQLPPEKALTVFNHFQQQHQTSANAEAARADRAQTSLVQIPDGRGGFVWSTRENAIGKGAPMPANSSAMTGFVSNPNLHGEDFLKTLPPQVQGTVKGIAEGRIDVRSMSYRGGNREAMLAAAAQYDPTWNQQTYAQRLGVMKDFTSGKAANNATAINTSIRHMGTLSDLGDALENKDVRAVNAIVNKVRTETGDERVNNFNTAKQAVGNELMRVFRQVQASEAETKDWEKRFSDANSPAQIKGAIRVGAQLLDGRIKELNAQYNRGMGTTGGFPGLISSDLQGVLSKITQPSSQSSIPGFSDEKEKRYQELLRKRNAS